MDFRVVFYQPPFVFVWLAGGGAAEAFGCSGEALPGVCPPPGLLEPSLEPLSFLRCSRFSLLLTLVSHVPEKKHCEHRGISCKVLKVFILGLVRTFGMD